jgi:hypothetical protein
MAQYLVENHSDKYDMMFTFANTGLEHSDTYRFLEEIDRNFLDGRPVKLEAEINPKRGKGTRHRVVNWNELDRGAGGPYEAYVKKYGIPNSNFPGCSRELKKRVCDSYTRSVWGTDFSIAIGIRMDEKRRVKKDAVQQRVIYPLIDMHPDQPDSEYVISWFKQFEWDLRIPSYLGNCVGCFKKGMVKLNAVWWDDPDWFLFQDRMEKEHGFVHPKGYVQTGNPMTFWRDKHSTETLTQMFKDNNNDNRARYKRGDPDKGVCDESCESFDMEIG